MWLDAAPILRAVEARGGLARCVPHNIPVPQGSADTSEFLRPPKVLIVMDRREYNRIRRAWLRMCDSGQVTWWCADWFCLTVLKLLPNELYGHDWWQSVPDWDHEHVWKPNGGRWACACGDTTSYPQAPVGGSVDATGLSDTAVRRSA